MDISDMRFRKPTVALVKLIEATGILLGIPKSFEKSRFKAPTPSNYDATLTELSQNFYNVLKFLAVLRSSGIPNDMGSALYVKCSEPGFNYEAAVCEGGLAMRELFNAVALIIDDMQNDRFRLPIRTNNVLVVIDGNRSSYTAFDAATHVFSHGKLTVVALTSNAEGGEGNEDYEANTWEQGGGGSYTDGGDDFSTGIIPPPAYEDFFGEGYGESRPSPEIIRAHLHEDLSRRCKLQYKLTDHTFCVKVLSASSKQNVQTQLEEELNNSQCGALVLGLDDCNLNFDGKSYLALWAMRRNSIPVVLAKGRARVRPFNAIAAPKTFLFCIKDPSHLQRTFEESIKFVKAGDFVVLVAMVETRDAKGDYKEYSRFDLGKRSGWVVPPPTGKQVAPRASQCLGWNDAEVQTLTNQMEDLLAKSQLKGSVRIERHSTSVSVAQQLSHIAKEEGADMMVLMNKDNFREVIVDCAREAPCSIILIN